MKRKDFLKAGAIAGTAGLVASCQPKQVEVTAPNIITNKNYKWKMVTTWPPNFPVVGTGCQDLATWIREMSSGRLDIRVYGGGELVPPLGVFEAVSGGSVEMGHGASYYWAGIEPAFQFFTSVPFGMNAQQMNSWLDFGGGQQLWEELYARFNIKPFAAGNTGVQMGGWFNRRIDTIDDFKGLKMRMPGLGGKVIQRVGATAVLSPGSELYTNLERGIIDATEWIGPYHDYEMGFHQIAKYYYSPGWHEAGSVLECIVNRREFEALPSDLQAIVRTACYRGNQTMLCEFEALNNAYLQRIKNETDVEILQFSDEILEQLKEVALSIYAELAKNDSWSKRTYASFAKFKKEIREWSKLAEGRFYAMNG
ncbi:MAG: TRAP transporter substrate-binding protein [Bacteroidota bacterium]